MSQKEGKYLQQWRSENIAPYVLNITVADVPLTIPPGVFNPSSNLTFSSSMLLENMPADLNDKSIMDMGTGSGIIAIRSALNNATNVLAIDIDKKALKAAEFNAQFNSCVDNITMVWSDLFHHIPTGQYDYIFANLPIIDVDFDDLYLRLLNTYKKHLKSGGELWLVYASFGDQDLAAKFFDAHPNLIEKLTKQKLGVTWYLYKFSK